MFLSGCEDFFRHRVAQGGDAVEWREEFAVDHLEFRGIGASQINWEEFEAAEVHFCCHFDDGSISFLYRRRMFQGRDAGEFCLLGLQAFQDDGRIEGAFGADGEVGRVVGQGLIHFEPGDAEGHHNVCHRMGAWEKVTDLETRINEPLRHIGCVKLGAVIGAAFFKTLPLADIFHDLEGGQRLHAVLDEIVHHVVTGGNRLLQFHRTILDKVLGIVQPHVGAVGETGNSYQFREILRPRVFEHAADEGGAVFREAQRTDGDAFISDGRRQFLRRQSQCFRRAEERQGLLVIEGNFQRVDAGDVLEHTNNFRIVVAQNIQLQHTAGDGVVVEVGGDGAGDLPALFVFQIFLIRRVLERREIVDVHISWANHDARRMLAGGALHAGHTGREFFDENIIECKAPVLRVFLHETVGRLVLDAGDGPGAEYIVAAEKFFRVLVGHALVVAGGEIEVDIRDLVAIEAKEYGEWDVVPILIQIVSAFRAWLIGQVEAAAHGAIFEELGPVAIRAHIVRRQRIDFRDAGHGGDEGRADGPSRTYQVAAVVGVLYQLVSDVV